MRTLYFLYILYLGPIISLCFVRTSVADGLEEEVEYEPDLIVADNLVIDVNDFNEENAFFEKANLKENLDRQEPWYTSHYLELTDGIEVIVHTQTDSKLLLFSGDNFPVWVGQKGDVRIGAGLYGKGRVVVSGRTSYFKSNVTESMTKFVTNAISWLANGKDDPVIASINKNGIFGHDKIILNQNLLALDGIDILWVTNQNINDEAIKSIKTFVFNGGALLVANEEFNFKGNSIDFPINKIVTHMGFMLEGKNKNRKDSLPVMPIPAAERNLWEALQTLKTDPTNEIAQNTVSRSSDIILKPEYLRLPQFTDLFSLAQDTLLISSQNSSSKVLFNSLSLKLFRLFLHEEPVNATRFMTSIDFKSFPFDVYEGATEITKNVTINGTTGKQPIGFSFSNPTAHIWRSTGLYIRAGTVAKVTVPESLITENLNVHIGAHSDTLWKKKKLKRSPKVLYKYSIMKATTNIASPFGGLLFIRIPRDKNLGLFEITVENAIEAPYFVLGKTSDEEWIAAVKETKSPWAELEAPGNVIFTVPTYSVVEVDNPTEIMTLWNDLFIQANFLAGFENNERHRPERFPFDRQISKGYAHSGYPIGVPLGLERTALNVKRLKVSGSWAMFHELGHNQQWKAWTIPVTTETGCNWWAMYMFECLGIASHRTTVYQIQRIHSWIFRGKPWNEWSVTLALDTYSLLANEFTWKSYAPVIQKYYTLSNLKLKTDFDKLDFWARTYMESVGYDLCYYYEWWGWKLANETLQLCESLPEYPVNILERFTHATEHGNCPYGWLSYEDSCFYFSEEKTNWYDVEKICETNHGAHLANCLGESEFHFLASKVVKHGYWVGGSDLAEADSFQYLNGESLDDYGLWKQEFPVSDDDHHCALLIKGRLKDDNCLSKKQYICKKSNTSCEIDTKLWSCPDGWVYFKGSCYAFPKGSEKFNAAQDMCKIMSGNGLGHLVEVISDEVQNFIQNSQLSDSWIDIKHKSFINTAWHTSGNAIQYQKWCHGYPTDGTRVVYTSKESKCWEDGPTSDSKGFICEMPMITSSP